MLKIGITGGIGSGKSTVCKIFNVLGIPVYHADIRAKILINQMPVIRENIIHAFGSESFTHNSYNSKYMGNIVFSNKEKLHRLNSIIHPYVEKDFLEWCANNTNSKYILKEAAILFESGANKGLDYVIVINAPLNIRIQRIIERDSMSEKMIMQRMQNQWPVEKIQILADWIIENDDKQLILPHVLSIHNRLIS